MSITYARGRRWKGKERELESRDEGTGGAGGIVLPLDIVGTGIYDVAYTIPVQFGTAPQQFSLQIDTGSSDLWVASTSCLTSSCKQTGGRLYDPSDSKSTGKDFSIPYLQGKAEGPIVWERVVLGGYEINNQAMAAADNVQDEPLSSTFSGILGLALPLNSIIAEDIPPVTSNAADGAAWASNLFSITPTSSAPTARFISLSLSRPGSDAVPALLGIGRHPAALVSDPSKIRYAPTVSERAGALFWKATVRAMTVYVNGVAKPVTLGLSGSGAVFPSAVLDSGVPLILTTSAVANAVYGALGVSPANDGMYYVPCTTPLNMTITLDDRPETPLHPLDLTTPPPSSSSNPSQCVGLIQAADGALSGSSSIGDMVLGVPFLRNVYMVMAYTVPNTDGTFPDYSADDNTDGGLGNVVRPRLGILSLTDPTTALTEFNTVRVLNQPLTSGSTGSGSTNGSSNTGSSSNTKSVNVGGKHLSVGVVVLIGLLSFFALCFALFGLRWWLFRRRFRRDRQTGPGGANEDTIDRKTAYRLARRTSSGAFAFGTLAPGAGGPDGPSEDELRQIRYAAIMRKGGSEGTRSTADSDRTLGADGEAGGKALGKVYQDEFGVWRNKSRDDAEDADGEAESEEGMWHPVTGLAWGANDTTLRNTRTRSSGRASQAVEVPLVSDQEQGLSPPSSPEQAHIPLGQGHRSVPSVAIPLLDRSEEREPRYTYAHENGYTPTSSGGVRRISARVGEVLPRESTSSSPDPALPLPSSPDPMSPSQDIIFEAHHDVHMSPNQWSMASSDTNVDEWGARVRMSSGSMAGVGSAARRSAFVRADSDAMPVSLPVGARAPFDSGKQTEAAEVERDSISEQPFNYDSVSSARAVGIRRGRVVGIE